MDCITERVGWCRFRDANYPHTHSSFPSHDANLSHFVLDNKTACSSAIINISTAISSIEKCPETFSAAQMYPYRISKVLLKRIKYPDFLPKLVYSVCAYLLEFFFTNILISNCDSMT